MSKYPEPCEMVIPFPGSKRIGLARRLAELMWTSTCRQLDEMAEDELAHKLKDIKFRMRSQRVPPEAAARELKAFETLVRAELCRLTMMRDDDVA